VQVTLSFAQRNADYPVIVLGELLGAEAPRHYVVLNKTTTSFEITLIDEAGNIVPLDSIQAPRRFTFLVRHAF
jgi:hypothetical protein